MLTLVGRGRSNTEIAEDLFITVAIAKSHLSRLLAKLGARDRVQLVITASDGLDVPTVLLRERVGSDGVEVQFVGPEQSAARVATGAPQGQARLSPLSPVGPQHPLLFFQRGSGRRPTASSGCTSTVCRLPAEMTKPSSRQTMRPRDCAGFGSS
ncbi:response regulator transcription factor [Streptomyces xanthophaeus]|uniref:response regulator transcription factor n=1 Tax=Streptomyces xanthophaeus TaxID=67385 RepID=UPI003F4D24A5